MAQKVNPDTLTMDQLNLYKHKAVTMRNAGMILTLAGTSISATAAYIDHSIIYFSGKHSLAPRFAIWTGLVSVAVGVPLWAVGGNRKAKAELTLQKFNIAPQGSMAAGLGITIRF